jgi:hypothetical protein
MPPFDSVALSSHIPIRGKQRGFTPEEATACITAPDRIEKTQGRGTKGGFIWKFYKSIGGRTLEIVAEVYKNTCYAITGYWVK